jgi:PAS domain S-box-containing protein
LVVVDRAPQRAVVLGAAALLACMFLLLQRDATHERRRAAALDVTNEQLEARIEARTAELRDANERLRSIIDSTVEGIIVIDTAGRIESFNPGAERLFGYPADEVIGRNISILMPSPYHEEHDGYLRRHLATGEARIIGIGREVVGRRRDGTIFPLHLSVAAMTVGGECKFTGTLHDLSDRVRAETQLREQASLVRLGELAAIIAHEVKNPLAGVRGAIEVIGGRLPSGAADAAIVREILGRIDALDDLMRELLVFARPPRPRVMPVEVAPLVAATAGLLGADPTLREVRVEIDGSVPPIQADPEMLKIVFQNLLVNAAHAMRGSGRIAVHVEARDGCCHVTFADDGPGIPVEFREKVFTAFFSTKSRGSGLGLPTAKRLVEAHSGQIRIDCPPAGGTIVTVQLPAESPTAA